jgi:SAM-dependent methyltransferase
MPKIINSILKPFNPIISVYSKSSVWGKLLVFIVLFLFVIFAFKGLKTEFKEGFEQQEDFLFKTGQDIYDDFYAEIYDYLVFNSLKDEYEIGEIINKTTPSSQSKVLDIGCGTGHHVAELASRSIDTIGIDLSPAMIKKAKENFPNYKFKVADALNSNAFEPNKFTHILCMYFTIYYFKDKEQFFKNCFNWLLPGGYLLVHLVDRDKFDPILPPGNPLVLVSPQKYAKDRITSTKVKFTDFAYAADFELDEKTDVAKFSEKFKNDANGKVRKQEHIMYMPELSTIVDEAQGAGFILEGQINLLQCQYEYQYVYIFTKPN